MVVFLGIAYIQQSVAQNLGFLIPFTSVLLALIAIHMMRNKLTYKPKKGNPNKNIWTPNMICEIKHLFLPVTALRWIAAEHTGSFLKLIQNVLPPLPSPEWRCGVLAGPGEREQRWSVQRDACGER